MVTIMLRTFGTQDETSLTLCYIVAESITGGVGNGRRVRRGTGRDLFLPVADDLTTRVELGGSDEIVMHLIAPLLASERKSAYSP